MASEPITITVTPEDWDEANLPRSNRCVVEQALFRQTGQDWNCSNRVAWREADTYQLSSELADLTIAFDTQSKNERDVIRAEVFKHGPVTGTLTERSKTK